MDNGTIRDNLIYEEISISTLGLAHYFLSI
jgi:hypothetical protein